MVVALPLVNQPVSAIRGGPISEASQYVQLTLNYSRNLRANEGRGTGQACQRLGRYPPQARGAGRCDTHDGDED